MPTIEATININADAADVYQAARDNLENLVNFLANVDEIQILEREGARTLSRWHGHVRAPVGGTMEFEWTEEDWWDDAGRRCRFKATEGDFDQYEGEWYFEDNGAGCCSRLVLHFEKVIPLFGDLIQGLLAKKVQEMSQDTLRALKEMVEAGQAGEAAA